MLVLTRKSNQRIFIGDDVEIVVLSVHGQRVKLGIVADASKDIRRSESCELPDFRHPVATNHPGS